MVESVLCSLHDCHLYEDTCQEDVISDHPVKTGKRSESRKEFGFQVKNRNRFLLGTKTAMEYRNEGITQIKLS